MSDGEGDAGGRFRPRRPRRTGRGTLADASAPTIAVGRHGERLGTRPLPTAPSLFVNTGGAGGRFCPRSHRQTAWGAPGDAPARAIIVGRRGGCWRVLPPAISLSDGAGMSAVALAPAVVAGRRGGRQRMLLPALSFLGGAGDAIVGQSGERRRTLPTAPSLSDGARGSGGAVIVGQHRGRRWMLDGQG